MRGPDATREWKTLYTSAVMLTEVIDGPPPLFLEQLWDVVRTGSSSSLGPNIFRPYIECAVHWTQLILWLACLGACYAARLRRKSHSPALIWSMTALMILSVIHSRVAAEPRIGRKWQRPVRGPDATREWKTLYTSAVMLTEVIDGPPPLFLEQLWDVVRTGSSSSLGPNIFRPYIECAVHWTQLILWLACLGACYAARLRRKSHSPALIWSMTALMILSVILLYATTVQFVGT